MKETTASVLLLATLAAAGVGPGSGWPDDALLIGDLIEARLHRPCLVSLAGPDSALVAFAALGGEWTASDGDWYALMLVYAVTSGVDMEKPWSILDVAVSFGDTWCSIPMEAIFALGADSALTEEAWWTELKMLTEIHPYGQPHGT